MYSIGVAVKTDRGQKELREIASDPDSGHVFMVQDYAAMQELNEVWDDSRICGELVVAALPVVEAGFDALNFLAELNGS